MRQRIKYLIFTLAVVFSTVGFTQVYNYQGIDVQGQVLEANGATVSLNFQIIQVGETLLWEEDHLDLNLYDQSTFQLTLGQGDYLGGSITTFEDVNWFEVDRVEIRRTDAGPAYLIGTYNLLPLPYSFHSLSCEHIPFTFELTDGIGSSPDVNYVLRYDGTQFFMEEEWLGDTAQFAYYSGTTVYADTVDFAFAPNDADSADWAIEADTAFFAWEVDSTIYADTAFYGDTAIVAWSALNNWSIDGNSGLDGLNFLGTTNAEDFNLGTNGIFAWRFGASGNVYKGVEYPGFSVDDNEGALFTLSNEVGPSDLTSSFLYFGGTQRAFYGGETIHGLDTAMGIYSFLWGKDNANSGTYATVFGVDNQGDSVTLGSTTYSAISSFTAGRGNRVSRTCVAIGDSCIANRYRNVAIGRKVIANTNNATLGIGWNVLSTGATAWALGQNVTASGNFSTVMGTNASTNGFNGGFVYGDFSTTDTVRNTAIHQFMVRAAGGYVFYSSSDLSTGVELAAGGGSWSVVSDRNVKENIQPMIGNQISNGIAVLPISRWTYKNRSEVHIGPMAQDLYDVFQVGESNRHINMIDFHGITFAGIKNLNTLVNQLTEKEELVDLQEEVEEEKQELIDMMSRIEALQNQMEKEGANTTEVIEK